MSVATVESKQYTHDQIIEPSPPLVLVYDEEYEWYDHTVTPAYAEACKINRWFECDKQYKEDVDAAWANREAIATQLKRATDPTVCDPRGRTFADFSAECKKHAKRYNCRFFKETKPRHDALKAQAELTAQGLAAALVVMVPEQPSGQHDSFTYEVSMDIMSADTSLVHTELDPSFVRLVAHRVRKMLDRKAKPRRTQHEIDKAKFGRWAKPDLEKSSSTLVTMTN